MIVKIILAIFRVLCYHFSRFHIRRQTLMKKVIPIFLIVCIVLSLFLKVPEEGGGIQTVFSSVSQSSSNSTDKQDDSWSPYTGPDSTYTYYYTVGSARAWDDDILAMVDTFLECHPYLTAEESRVTRYDTIYGKGYYTDEYYDPELRAKFLQEINDLIPKLRDMDDVTVAYELQRIVAMLKDGHACVQLPTSDIFPFLLTTIRKDNNTALHVVLCPKKHHTLLLAELIAINGVPVEKIMEDLLPYISCENLYWAESVMASPDNEEMLIWLDALRVVGVIGAEEATATFDFILKDGTPYTVELEAITQAQHRNMTSVYTHYDTFLRYDSLHRGENYWYSYLLKEDLLYFRIDTFHDDEEQSLRDMENAILGYVKSIGGVEKFVLDLRANMGGYNMTGYEELANVLGRMDAGRIYVLMDSNSFSRSVITASILKNSVDNLVLVGEPAGQPPNFFGNVYSYNCFNKKVSFSLATDWIITMDQYPYDALMPDVIVYQTIEDYKQKRDAIMQYVIADTVDGYEGKTPKS